MKIVGFFLVLLFLWAKAIGPEVTVTQGRLQGWYRTTRGNRSISAFEGVPFAEPPLGELRFKAPVPVGPWEGIKNVSQPHNICIQRNIFAKSTKVEGDEDCLYLNVYTPQLNNKLATPLPVMIFFHGGAWLFGSGNSLNYGPDILLDRDVVLVVANYRLAVLGFLSTGDAASPGNYGLKDQIVAMRWVKKNIEVFGGDPNKITIFGQSVGGVSMELHMMSPLNDGLFQAGIMQSGTAHCSWGLEPIELAVKRAKMIGTEFGCNIDNSTKMVECLKNVSASDLVATDHIFLKWDIEPLMPFRPVIEPALEGAFLIQHPIDSFKSGKFIPVPWIVGFNANEGAVRAAGIYGNPQLIVEYNEKFDQILPMSLMYDETSPDINYTTSKIREFYFGTRKIDEASRWDVVDMYTDAWFLSSVDKAIRYYLKYSNQPIYYYLFAHKGVTSYSEIFGDKVRDYGVSHMDDLQYLFPVGDTLFPGRPPNARDKKMAQILTTLWVNFAKTGNPTPITDDVITHKWMPVTGENMEYYHINLEGPVMKQGLFRERAEFWRSLPIRAKINSM